MRSRLPLLLAIACALFVRTMVPAGWMPAETGGVFAIQPCPSAGDGLALQNASHHSGKGHDRSHSDHQDCGFSPLNTAAAAYAGEPPSPVAAVHGAAPHQGFETSSFSTGLPSPPPPATGPPATA
jgi:hypothetical protein